MCEAARAGSRDARMGPSVFVHGPDVLIDTPEESRLQLARSGVSSIGAALYSHWHHDHTAGRRVWEMNFDFRGWPREAKQTTCTPVYLPQQVARDFEAYLGLADQFRYLEHLGVVRIHEVADGEAIVGYIYVGYPTVQPAPRQRQPWTARSRWWGSTAAIMSGREG